MRSVRWFLAALILMVGVGLVSYLQYRFDRSDVRNAVEAVRLNRGEEGCTGRLLSRWKGWVVVKCPAANYQVDVVKGVIEKTYE